MNARYVMADLRAASGMPPFTYRDLIDTGPPPTGPSPIFDQLARPARYQIRCSGNWTGGLIYDCPHIAQHAAALLDVTAGCGPHTVTQHHDRTAP